MFNKKQILINYDSFFSPIQTKFRLQRSPIEFVCSRTQESNTNVRTNFPRLNHASPFSVRLNRNYNRIGLSIALGNNNNDFISTTS